MNLKDLLKLGSKYSKSELSEILDEINLKSSREGIYNCKNHSSTLLFVTLDKSSKDSSQKYNDYFEEDFFHWDSQNKQHINTPGVQKIIGEESSTNLFVRINSKIKNQTNPFVYCGELKYDSHEIDTSNPVHIIFENTDYDDFTDDEDLIDIYLWSPSKIGKKTSSKINKKGVVSKRREVYYKKPTITEQKGFIKNRVGQSYFRQQNIRKWNGECPVTGCNILTILKSSHIVPWSESNNDERLDVNNGILLSPNIDSLFDKHLISFSDEGKILISSKINDDNRIRLGINENIKIPINNEMIKYLRKHQEKFHEIN